MMQVQVERDIYIHATRAHDLLRDSIELFRKFLDPTNPATDPQYYRARSFLKEGKAFFDKTLQDAKKLLGPIPIYAAKDFEGWRSQVLVENKIVVQGQTLEALRTELEGDEFVRTIMSPEEIDAYLQARFEAQKTGKRKLANIKVRMTLDKLALMLGEAQDFQKTAQRKQQGLPV